MKHEMQWTILWFQHQANLWSEHSKREDMDLPVGYKVYAVKPKELWSAFQRKASERFSLYIL